MAVLLAVQVSSQRRSQKHTSGTSETVAEVTPAAANPVAQE